MTNAYTPCELRMSLGTGYAMEAAWIPAELAHVGSTLSLLIGGQWYDDWELAAVYDAAASAKLTRWYPRDCVRSLA